MKTLYIILILFFGLLFSSKSVNAQTITKKVNKTSVYVGEEFTYTIAIDNINNLNNLNTIVDDFGQNVDILSVDYGNTLDLLITWGICSVSHTTTNNILTVDFPNCSGAPIGGRVSLDITVRLNQNACNLTQYNNKALLNLSNSTVITSNNTSVSIDNSNPFELQKSYFKYEAGTEQLYYDVRLSSKSGNFFTIQNGTELLRDTFTIPNCFQNITRNDIEVFYVPDEGNRTVENTIPYNTQLIGNQLIADWQLPTGIQNTNESSLLFVVKIKLKSANCQCTTSYSIENEAEFRYNNVCNIQYDQTDRFDFQKDNNYCDFSSGMPSGGSGVPSTGSGSGGGSSCELEFGKSYQLEGNDMGLTMKGCKGKYFITVRNCSDSLVYNKINIKDIVPTEVRILGVNNPGFTLTRNGSQLNFLRDSMQPGEAHTIEIGFSVTTNLQDHLITNCAEIDLEAENQFNNNQKQLTRNACTSFKTVPNKVTVVTRKSICSIPSQSCGFAQKDSYLPDDEVEYELFFYNYGSADGTNVTIEDRLPRYFDLQSIEVFKNQSGSSVRREPCNLDEYEDITSDVVINKDRRTNSLKIGLQNHILDAFTCKGVSFYKIRIKGKINANVVSGQYRNQFVVDYEDQSRQTNVQAVSNMAPYTVNLDNFIMINKSIINEQSNCDNHTQKVTYQVKVYNLGNTAVNVDIEDFIPNISNVNITQGINYPNQFRSCLQIGPPNPNSCIPTPSLANINGTLTTSQNGFRLIKQKTYPCTMLIIEYDVIFDTQLLTKDEVVEACNQLKVWAYTGNVRIRHDIFMKNPSAYQNNIIVSSQPIFNEMYLNAITSEEQLYITQLVKAYKTNPAKFSTPNKFNKIDALGNLPGIPSLGGKFFGIDEDQDCTVLKDCLKEFPTECINSRGSSDIKLEITGINSNTGEISTTLTNNTPNRISKVEYILTDVTHQEIECETIYIGPRPLGCNTCTGNITGEFRPKNNTSLGGLNLAPNNYNGIVAVYKEQNVIVYENLGASSTITTENKNFMFPKIKNCSAHFELSITAIIYFENCDTCFATDSIDFRTKYDLRNILIHNSASTSHYHRIP